MSSPSLKLSPHQLTPANHTPFHQWTTPPQQPSHPTILYATPHTTCRTHKPWTELESHWQIFIFRLLFPYSMQIKYPSTLSSLTHLHTHAPKTNIHTRLPSYTHTLIARLPKSSHNWDWIWKILWQLPFAFKYMKTFKKSPLLVHDFCKWWISFNYKQVELFQAFQFVCDEES